jgi:acyl-CoA thioester hydrolase/thioesterase-3
MPEDNEQASNRYARFETELPVIPRDIDVNGHVHHSVYFDYLLAARFDQMDRCYKMSMEAFLKMGFTWVARKYEIEYRSGIQMGDTAVVRTWISKIGKVSVDVGFQIFGKSENNEAARGMARYVLIDFRTNKPVIIPKNVLEKYSILEKDEVSEENIKE